MKSFLVLTGYSIHMYLRDKTAVFWGVLFPILLMGLIGAVFSNAGSVAFSVSVVDEFTGHPLVSSLRKGLEDVPVFKLSEEPRERAMTELRKGKRSIVVIFPRVAEPAGQSSPYQLEVFYDEGRTQVSQAALAILQQVLGEVNVRYTGAPVIVTMKVSGVSTTEMSMFDFLLPGIMAMTLMQTGLMGVTWLVATYREKLVLKRVLATPVRPVAFLSGLIARFTLVNLLQVILIFLIGTLVFKAKVVGSLGALGLLTVIGSVTFLAMGFAISTVSKTAESANTLGSLLNFPMMFLSGTFWPRELIPQVLQPLISALPLTPLVEAMRGVAAGGQPIANFLPGVGYLLLWSFAGFLFAIRFLQWGDP